MKHSALRVCLPFGLFLAVPLAVAASASAPKWKVEVIVAIANVRSTPAMSGAIITRLPKGTVLEAEKADASWFKVTLPPDKEGVVKVGYIHQSVVSATEVSKAAPKAPPPAKPKAEKVAAPAAVPQGAAPSAAPRPASKKKFEINFLGGAGFTAVDIAKDLEISEEYLEDWNKFHWRIAAQAIYRLTPKLGVGAEAGFSSLYYYYYIYPMTEGQNAYRENTITGTTLGGLVDFRFGRYFFFQVVAGILMYGETTVFNLGSALGAEIPINDSLSVPIMIRDDIAFSGPSPIALVAGLKVKI
jgi:hypothetical protein